MLSNKKNLLILMSIVSILLVIHALSDKSGPLRKMIQLSFSDNKVENVYSDNNIDSYVYQLQINENHIYYLQSLNEIESVLDIIAEASVDNGFDPDVSIEYNPNQYKPLIRFTSRLLQNEERTDSSPTQLDFEDRMDSNKEKMVNSNLNEDKLISLSFNENILIRKIIQKSQKLTSVNNVVNELLKLNVEPAAYKVQPGDSASVIAKNNDMTLNELYEINPKLKENEYSLQIDDQIIVEKLTPELSIISCYESKKTEPIPFKSEYREDSSIYTGLTKVYSEGSEGTLLVISDKDVINDNVFKEEKIDTQVILEPKPKIILSGTKPVPKDGAAGFFIAPLDSYRLTSSYGPRWERTHTGIDMAVTTGTPVKSTDGGKVIFAGWDNSYGYRIDIDHGNGKITRYAHNSKLLVKSGEVVGQGELIAKSGNTGNSTGPHLHFELIINGKAVNPLNYIVS